MEEGLKKKIWAVGGGKGGVGKSIVTMMLGTMLATRGKKVILVDADLGGSNLHILGGIKYPIFTLADFLQHRVDNIEDVIMLTPVKNLQIICGADDILGLANPRNTQKERIFNNLKKLDADFILLDLGAGTSYTSLDFFIYAPNKIVVLTPQITSIQNSYGFIKSSLFRLLLRSFSKDDHCLEYIKQLITPQEEGNIDSMEKLKSAFMALGDEEHDRLNSCLKEFNMGLVVNMVRDRSEGDVGRIVQNVANDYLDVCPEYLGFVNYDPTLNASINNMEDYLIRCTDSLAGACFSDIANKIITKNYKETNTGPDLSHLYRRLYLQSYQ